MFRTSCCLASFILLCGNASFGAGELDRIREEVREKKKEKEKKKKKKKPKPDKTSDDKSKDDDDSGGGDGFDLEIFEALVHVFTSPFWLPHEALEDDFDRPGYFLPYPYAAGGLGHMIIDRRPEEAMPAGLARRWALRVCIEDSDDFEAVNRFSGHFLLSSSDRFGLDSTVTYMTERLGGGGTDSLVIGDANVVIRFAQSETSQFRAGVGLAFMSDEAGADFGFNFTYGADIFPGRLVVLSGSLDLGSLGKEFVFHWRLTAGALLARSEIYAGYDSMSIGSVDIGGPVLGLRFWF